MAFDHIVESRAESRMPDDYLPRRATGKTRLHLATRMGNQVRPVVPPGSMVELHIADIWQRLLRLTDIGVEDDFFELGGDFFLAAQMILELETFMGQHIPQSRLRAMALGLSRRAHVQGSGLTTALTV
jgi:hypothetical protein